MRLITHFLLFTIHRYYPVFSNQLPIVLVHTPELNTNIYRDQLIDCFCSWYLTLIYGFVRYTSQNQPAFVIYSMHWIDSWHIKFFFFSVWYVCVYSVLFIRFIGHFNHFFLTLRFSFYFMSFRFSISFSHTHRLCAYNYRCTKCRLFTYFSIFDSQTAVSFLLIEVNKSNAFDF